MMIVAIPKIIKIRFSHEYLRYTKAIEEQFHVKLHNSVNRCMVDKQNINELYNQLMNATDAEDKLMLSRGTIENFFTFLESLALVQTENHPHGLLLPLMLLLRNDCDKAIRKVQVTHVLAL